MWNAWEASDDQWGKCIAGKDTNNFSSPEAEVARTMNSRLVPRNGRDWRTSMGITLT